MPCLDLFIPYDTKNELLLPYSLALIKLILAVGILQVCPVQFPSSKIVAFLVFLGSTGAEAILHVCSIEQNKARDFLPSWHGFFQGQWCIEPVPTIRYLFLRVDR